MVEMQLEQHRWTLGRLLGARGFASVHEATNESGDRAALKPIPKDQQAGRDLLFADVEAVRGAQDVVPVIDKGAKA